MLTTVRLRRCRQLTIIEVLLVGGAEIYRNTEQNIERRQYPGGVFDPLGLASGSDERAFNLKTAELKHGRLAMIAFLGAHTAALPGCLLCQTHLQHCCMPPLFTIKSTDSIKSTDLLKDLAVGAQVSACRRLYRVRAPLVRSPSSQDHSTPSSRL